MNKISNKSAFVTAVLIPLAVGFLSAVFSKNMTIYSSLNKPAFSPPGFIFPIVWTILYILMGISSYIIYSSDNVEKTNALNIYGLQLFFNFGWSIIFFGFRQYLFAFFWLLILILLICIMIVRFYKISPIAAYLQIPYLLWCLFAAVLNYSIYQLN